jgi:hypothetical protein
MKNLKFSMMALAILVLLSACSPAQKTPSNEEAESGDAAAVSEEVSSPVAEDSSAEAEVGVPDACKVMTKEIAEMVVGSVGDEPTDHFVDVTSSICSWTDANSSSLSLQIMGALPLAEVKASFESVRKEKGAIAVKVDGLGDDAYVSGVNEISILKGNNYLIVSGNALKNEALESIKAAAKKILANM